jgi:DNA-binding LacI/PurR family transcriptional regulator
MGKRSAERLIELINGELKQEETQILMEIELIVRQSTGPVPMQSSLRTANKEMQ